MTTIEEAIKELEQPGDVRFSRLVTICTAIFGTPRQNGTSHVIFKTGIKDPALVNLQLDKGGKAKDYQVKQVTKALQAVLASRK